MSTDDLAPRFDPFDLEGIAEQWSVAPVCWKILTETSATREWAALDEWVRWLVARYALSPRTVPPCWDRHGALIEELSALRTGWLSAYCPDAPGNAPLDWHAMLAATRGRTEDAIDRVGCTKDDHREDRTPGWLSEKDPHTP
jgi:hypothetical protein